MHRIVNRTPFSVKTPDIDYEFFVQGNWKGLCTNYNYYNIDQETFEECNNVYINEASVLSSRPPISALDPEGMPHGHCIKTWAYGDRIAYLCDYNDYYFIFDSEKGILDNQGNVTSNTQTMFFDDDILIFNEDDIKTNKKFYAPIIKVYVNDSYVESDNVESENLLYTGYKIKYIYDNQKHVNSFRFVGKEIKVNIDNDSYNTKFYDDTYKLILSKKIELPYDSYSKNPGDNEDNRFYLGAYSSSVPLIQIQNGIFMIPRYIADNTWRISYSLDGNIFNELPDVSEVIGLPKLSEDGSVILAVKQDGVYAISLVQITGETYYDNWTKIYELTNSPVDSMGIYAKNINDWAIIYNKIENDTEFTYIIDKNNTDTKTLVNTVNNNIRRIDNYINFKVRRTNDENLYLGLVSSKYTNLRLFQFKPIDNNITYGDVLDATIVNSFDADFVFNNDELLIAATVTTHSIVRLYYYEYDSVNKNYTYVKNFSDTDGNVARLTLDSVMTDKQYNESPNIVKNLYPLVNGDILYYATKGVDAGTKYLYTNDMSNNTVILTEEVKGEIKPLLFEHQTELDVKYISKGNKLYISEKRQEGEESYIYFPKINIQQFNKPITNLHPISKSQVGIFFEDELWYTELTDYGYSYYKSKINLGCKEGGDVITSYDGQNVIFSTVRGLAYLSYQDFVQSTDQTLTFLSDNIFELYNDYQTSPVKLFIYRYWIYCYNKHDNFILLLDMRNNSWWKWTYGNIITNIFSLDDKIIFNVDIDKDVAYNFRFLNTKYNDYHDYVTDTNGLSYTDKISWNFISQKLHLNSITYYKNINSIIVNSVQSDDEKVSFNIYVRNYRTSISDKYDEPQNLEYKVEALRTYVIRCNSRKVNEFQYEISSDDENINATILYIHSIVIKYTIGGEIR